MNKKINTTLAIIAITIITGIFGWLIWKNEQGVNMKISDVSTGTVNSKKEVIPNPNGNAENIKKNNQKPANTTESKTYRNDSLGISFEYDGNEKSYIEEKNGKLWFVDFIDGEYYKVPQFNLEVYEKIENDSLDNSVKNLMSKQGAKLDNCKLSTTNENGQVILKISFKTSFEEDAGKCLNTDEGPECSYSQWAEYTNTAHKNCSDFANGSYDNFFIYQPQNTKKKVVFVRYISGMDAAPWDITTITLFDKK